MKLYKVLVLVDNTSLHDVMFIRIQKIYYSFELPSIFVQIDYILQIDYFPTILNRLYQNSNQSAYILFAIMGMDPILPISMVARKNYKT